MLIRRSTYVHLTPLGEDRVLIVHAMSHLRLVVDAEVAGIVAWFEQARDMPGDLAELRATLTIDADTLAGCLASLMERGVLTDQDAAGEAAIVAAKLSELHGRDPGEALDQLRRQQGEGANPYWSVTSALGAADMGGPKTHRWDVLLFGDCDLQMEADFLRREAAHRDVDLRVAASFPDDLRLAAERPHQAIFVGALRSRHLVAKGSAANHGGDPAALYLMEARNVIEGLRVHSDAPILIDGLPEPTVQPLGLADRGPHAHRNRFRAINRGLEALADDYSGVYVVDIAATLAAEGAARLMDDGLVGFTHFGSPGWMLQRPSAELAAVHDIFPDTAPLAALVGPDLYRREAIVARAHLDLLAVVMGLGRKKCVILDLDGTLWPGVLAETGAPFAWTPEISGHNSYIGLYFGLHEALKALKRRGILLACVSKNDEALVRELWKYPDHYPHDRLLTPDDFVTWRVNWQDKPSNIASIAEELGFALDAFVFIDDHPVERERVRQALPQVDVLGENPFALRQILLTDPRFQALKLTEESAARTDLVKAQLGRDRQRAAAGDSDGFLASLEVVTTFDRPSDAATLTRVAELFQRTTQFNTTGRVFSESELAKHAEAGQVFVAHCRDRFGDYGLVAAAVVEGAEIAAFAMSCRVIGLKVEHQFLGFVLSALADGQVEALGRIVETARNGPVRHLYADNGFAQDGEVWRKAL
ncbi:MAG TPA: HAD-IIIC family phosphatase [Phenylobacterium sp.]|uniref:HAD-IIIC family phosphatase n=1 Tax=Phenylobacterium sp. TaxID=1871053 RepID=UPI002D233585|nr:HAD-IIIC family phosphatase [Phenylobacterium sp.]HZZ66558.1 HAD-IIIC family phosphatase [Phenylobacterium sp.]